MFKRIAMLGMKRYSEIDGTSRGAAFAYYAFFSLFPLTVLFVTIGSLFLEQGRAIQLVIGYAEKYVPLETEMKRTVFDTISGVVKTRGQVGLIAGLVLVWGSLRFFRALVRGTNRAWKSEVYNWWQMPLKSLQLLGVLGSALLIGLVFPLAATFLEKLLPPLDGMVEWGTALAVAAVPTLVLFYGVVVFYRLAPRRATSFAEVWPAALVVTIVLRGLETLFMLYLQNFGKFNVVYGTFAGIMALLMWIYLSGCVIIMGTCLAAAGAELKKADSAK